ncbi:serine protease FAM111A-like isoform X1 [Hyperolius riggenbachi]|uniref:serine protease FAM111A-like isoform X1 n=1 Tax=Hyperolius riggenbachi TaxID=752182 RepID=UPI0035A3A201
MEGEITVSETTCIQNTTIQHSMPSNGKSGGCDWLTNNREISMKRKSLGKQSQDVKQYSGVEMPVISTAGRKRQAGPPTKKCKQGKKKLSDITGRVINIENGQRTKQPITTEKDQSSDTVDKENCAENFERTKTRDDLKKAGYGEANMARPHPENEPTIECKVFKEEVPPLDSVSVRYRWTTHSKEGLISVSAHPHTMIIDALKTSEEFTKIYKGTHYLTIFANRMRAQVNPSAPCGALGKEEELELRQKYIRNKPPVTPPYVSDTEGRFIKVCKKGETSGGHPRVILHYNESSKDGIPLAVYGPKHGTIADALDKDKRFKHFDSFKLQGTKGETFESHTKLYQLPEDTYTVIVPPKVEIKNSKNLQEAFISNLACSSNSLNNDLSALVPDCNMNEAMRKTAKNLRNIFKEYVKSKGGLCKAWHILRGNFCNSVKENPLAGSTLKLLAKHVDNVGWVVVREGDEIIPLGTCFLLTGLLCLTNHHVVAPFLDKAHVYYDKNRKIIFNYDQKGQNLQTLQPGFSFEIISYKSQYEGFDYAFLRLDGFPHPGCPEGLLKYVAVPPAHGAVSIMGHPGDQHKQVDTKCSVINFNEGAEGCAGYSSFVSILSRYNFFSMENPRLLNYNTCLREGSSGSPVFNDHGQLVAMHTGWYEVPKPQNKTSVIEYGRSVVDIVIYGAVEIEDLCIQLKDIVTSSKALITYIQSVPSSSRMEPVITQLLRLWGYRGDPTHEFNDSGSDENMKD